MGSTSISSIKWIKHSQSARLYIVPFCKAQKTKYREFFQWRKDQGSIFPSTSEWIRSVCVMAPAFQPWLNLLFCIWSLVIEYFWATRYMYNFSMLKYEAIYLVVNGQWGIIYWWGWRCTLALSFESSDSFWIFALSWIQWQQQQLMVFRIFTRPNATFKFKPNFPISQCVLLPNMKLIREWNMLGLLFL